MRSEAVGASVGSELLKNGSMALFVAILLMIAYITWRYEWRFAVTAIMALFHDVLVTLAVFSICQLEVESYFIAAVLTILGYSVNNTIVIFDRIRENTVRVKKDQLAEESVNLSDKQSLTRTLNTSISTLILAGGFVLVRRTNYQNVRFSDDYWHCRRYLFFTFCCSVFAV